MTFYALIVSCDIKLCTDREHVVDTLMHVWMLDGRIITGIRTVRLSIEYDSHCYIILL